MSFLSIERVWDAFYEWDWDTEVKDKADFQGLINQLHFILKYWNTIIYKIENNLN